MSLNTAFIFIISVGLSVFYVELCGAYDDDLPQKWYEIVGPWYVLSAIRDATNEILPRCWNIEISELFPKSFSGVSSFFDERINQTVHVVFNAYLKSEFPEREDGFNVVVNFAGGFIETKTIQLREIACGRFVMTDRSSIALEMSRDPRSKSLLNADDKFSKIFINNTFCHIYMK